MQRAKNYRNTEYSAHTHTYEEITILENWSNATLCLTVLYLLIEHTQNYFWLFKLGCVDWESKLGHTHASDFLVLFKRSDLFLKKFFFVLFVIFVKLWDILNSILQLYAFHGSVFSTSLFTAIESIIKYKIGDWNKSEKRAFFTLTVYISTYFYFDSYFIERIIRIMK